MTSRLLAPGTFAAALVAETRSEALKALRVPVFLISTFAFPAMFYVLFALMFGRGSVLTGLVPAAYLLASYGTFGVVGAAPFGSGVGVASDRGQGWLTLKRATPMPPLAYFLAKVVLSMGIGAVIVATLALLGYLFGGVRLGAGVWALLLATLTLGAIPFCALGCALGYLSGPSSAPVVANLVYLPMSLAAGLWIPIELMPGFVQRIAPLMPPYHLARLALGPIRSGAGEVAGTGSGWPGAPDAAVHLAALLGFTVFFLVVAVLAYRRDDGRTWG